MKVEVSRSVFNRCQQISFYIDEAILFDFSLRNGFPSPPRIDDPLAVICLLMEIYRHEHGEDFAAQQAAGVVEVQVVEQPRLQEGQNDG
jgi:hypothetical protein